MLSVMQTPSALAAGQPLPPDYTVFLAAALQGARIGVDASYFTPDYGGEPDLDRRRPGRHGRDDGARGNAGADRQRRSPLVFRRGIHGAALRVQGAQIADYLQALSHLSMRTLADLIAFNLAPLPDRDEALSARNCSRSSESTSGDLTDPDYLAARAFSLASAGVNGIDAAMMRDKLDAIIAPSYSFASTPAVAGYPNISVPVGLTPEGQAGGHLDV